MEIEKRFTFEAAHRLLVPTWSSQKNKEVFGKCFNLHGHSYKLYIAITGNIPENGMIIHFTRLKKWLKEHIISRLDHTYLNDLPEFQNIPTTVENTVSVISQILKKNWPFPDIQLKRITLYETETSSCTLKVK